MSKRMSISKSARFAIFARDKFTCGYCGRQPPEVRLVIEHVIPVCQDGTNDDSNLKASCESCNQGKGGKTIAQAAPTEFDRLRMAQEHLEDMAVARLAKAAAKARKALRNEILNYWCEITGDKEMPRRSITRLAVLCAEFGSHNVFEWIETAAFNPSVQPDKRLMYINGIARNTRHREAA